MKRIQSMLAREFAMILHKAQLLGILMNARGSNSTSLDGQSSSCWYYRQRAWNSGEMLVIECEDLGVGIDLTAFARALAVADRGPAMLPG